MTNFCRDLHRVSRRRHTGACLVFLLAAGITATACDRVDQQKFDAVYRAGKALEVNMDTTGGVQVTESQKMLTLFQTEISLLNGRTTRKSENAALSAYTDAAEAYKGFLTMRSLDLRGDSREGRLLLGDGWLPVFAKFKIASEAAPSDSGDKYKFYWVRLGDAMTALSDAAKRNMTEGHRLVNAQS